MDKNVKKALRWDSGLRTTPPKQDKDSYSSGEYAMSFACLRCRTSNMRHFDVPPINYPDEICCPICSGKAINLGRHFKPPKKSDLAQWKKIAYLIEHGFYFQKIRTDKNSYESVPYPKTLAEAKEFVKKYKEFARTPRAI